MRTCTVLAKKSLRFYIVLLYKNVNFFWSVLYHVVAYDVRYSSVET